MGWTQHTLYFIDILAFFKNLINLAQIYSYLALHGIYALCQIKYPIASGEPLASEIQFQG